MEHARPITARTIFQRYQFNLDRELSAPQSVRLLSAADIRPEPIRWLWNGWLARGKIHVLAGPPGVAKTTIALKIAATITTGAEWPDGGRSMIGNVLIWSGEDDPKDTLVPRLMAMGADLSNIFFVGTVNTHEGPRPFDPAQDMDRLRDEAIKLGDVALLIVDPIVSAVAGDSHKNSETRRSLQPVVDLAEQLDAAVLGISHYTKGTQGRDWIERVTGSIAFGAVPRVIMGAAKVMREEGGPDRILVRAKSNIGPDGGGFEYSLDQIALKDHPAISASSVRWGPSLNGTAQNLLSHAEGSAGGPGENSLTEAIRFLHTELADGPVPSKELETRAKDAGIATRTLDRAKKAVGARADRDGATKKWLTSLPPALEDTSDEGQQGRQGCQDSPPQKRGDLGVLTSLDSKKEDLRGVEKGKDAKDAKKPMGKGGGLDGVLVDPEI